MAKKTDSMYERGFNVAYYLYEYSPHIIERAMDGLDQMPEDFLKGLKAGLAESRKKKAREEKENAQQESLQYLQHMQDEKRKENEYQDRLKVQKRQKEEKALEVDKLMRKEFETDHVQKRLEELNVIKKREEQAIDKKHEAEKLGKHNPNLEKTKTYSDSPKGTARNEARAQDDKDKSIPVDIAKDEIKSPEKQIESPYHEELTREEEKHEEKELIQEVRMQEIEEIRNQHGEKEITKDR